MGEVGNTTGQVTPGTNPPIPDPHAPSGAGGQPTPRVPDGWQVQKDPETGSASSAPDSSPPHKPVFPPFALPPGAGGVQNPAAPPPNPPFGDGRDPGQPGYRNPGIPGQPGYVSPYTPSQDVPPSALPPSVPGGGIGGIDSAGGARSPYLPDPSNPFPFGGGPGGIVPPVTIDPSPGAGPGPGATTPPPPPQLPYVPGYGIPPAGTPPGPPVTETHTTPRGDEASPMAPTVPGFDPKPPPSPGEPGAADDEDSGPRVEIG
ncbi:MAG: hypothetical protein P4L84_26365 [Isosphaeraceae bacterium]|jgi:hypothetical protein|nr:hypothetical protein [Isosphaeraceae bacterium]